MDGYLGMQYIMEMRAFIRSATNFSERKMIISYFRSSRRNAF